MNMHNCQAHCMTLRRRGDRWTQFVRDYPSAMPTCTPYYAVDGHAELPPGWWRGPRGAWGAVRTMVNLLALCMSTRHDEFLFFQDDAVPYPDADWERLALSCAALPDDWQWFYIGGNVGGGFRRQVNEYVCAPVSVGGSHSFFIRRPAMLALHDALLEHSNYAGINHYDDMLFMKMQREGRVDGVYSSDMWYFGQRQSFSDIECCDLPLRNEGHWRHPRDIA